MQNTDKDKMIRRIISSYEDYALGDIRKSLKVDMLISTFILCCCFIDSMANRRYYGQKMTDTVKWDKFFRKYFPDRYKTMGKEMYSHLRCKILHNYSGNRHFALGDDTDQKNHLTNLTDKRIFLHVKNFVKDTTSAYNSYKGDLLRNNEVRKIALDHDRHYPIFKYSKA